MACQHANRFHCEPAVNSVKVIAVTGSIIIDELCCAKHTIEWANLWRNDTISASQQYLHLHVVLIGAVAK